MESMAVGLRNIAQHPQAVYKTPKFNNTHQELGRKAMLIAYTNPVQKACCKEFDQSAPIKLKESQHLLNFGLVSQLIQMMYIIHSTMQ